MYTYQKNRIITFILTLFIAVSSLTSYQRNMIKFVNLPAADIVRTMFKDKNGVMWFGTEIGLVRYDGYETRTYSMDINNPDAISSNVVYDIFEDSDHTLWLCTTRGLNHFDPETEKFIAYLHEDTNYYDESWTGIVEGDKVWIVSGNGLEYFDKNTKKYTVYSYKKSNGEYQEFNTLCIDSDKNIWCGGQEAFVKFDRKKLTFKNYTTDTTEGDYPKIGIVQIIEDSNKDLWITDYGQGLLRMNRETETFKLYSNIPGNPQSLSSNFAYCLLEDRFGTIWIGTDGGGVNRFNQDTQSFTSYKHSIYDTDSLSNNIVISLAEDADGSIYCGTYGNGVDIYKQGNFYNYKNNPEDKNSLSDNKINSFKEDNQGNIWFITEKGGLNKFDRKTETFTVFKDSLLESGTSIAIDHDGIIWIGTWYYGLIRFDPHQNSITNIEGFYTNSLFVDSENTLWICSSSGLMKMNRQENKAEEVLIPGIPEGSVSGIVEDSDRNLWIGIYDRGVAHYNKTDSSVKVYNTEEYGKKGFLENIVNNIYEDSNRDIWFSTNNGVTKMEKKSGRLTAYTTAEGFPTKVIRSMTEDASGSYWFSTDIGLVKASRAMKQFSTFNSTSGLLSDSFLALKSLSNNEMITTSTKGFSIFDPAAIQTREEKPRLLIRAGISGKYDFLENNSTIELTYQKNEFPFEMFLIDLKNPSGTGYRYILEGYDQDWIDSQQIRFGYYKKLQGGSYTLRVKGRNSDGIWSDETAIKLHVETAPWITWWAFALYITAFTLLLFLIIKLYIQYKMRIKENELKKEKEIIEKLKALDKLKDDFLANTSHELRTPLNGIIGIIESAIDGDLGEVSKVLKQNLALVAASGKRLEGLVNDILDFSRLKNNELSLQFKPVGIREVTDIVLLLSKPLLKGKKVELHNLIPQDIPTVKADENRLQQIMYNLIGNAIKFTERGRVEVSASVPDTGFIEVAISDTGIGIPQDKFNTIFTSFEQADSSISREYGGTGLGLSVTKDLVELHGGQIKVKSTVGEGSTFFLTLPVSGEKALSSGTIQDKISRISLSFTDDTIGPEEELSSTDVQGKGNTILVVDDEVVNRQVLKNQLSAKGYRVLEAENGAESLRIVEEQIPDLIVLDIMMPKMSGLEVCRTLKENDHSKHIPVILLTAKNQLNDLTMGFSTGANDYITKPFSKSELLIRINNILSLKDSERLQKEMEIAERIQTAIVPSPPVLENFEIAAALVPAEEVGGDYYDIIIDKNDDLWLAIGDVSGHGVTSGLIMMMAETAFLTNVNENPGITPKEVIERTNGVLYENINQRMVEEHYMTMTYLKHEGEGSFTYSGAHMDILIYRRKSGIVENIPTTGLFLGFLPDISTMVKNESFSLEIGDILLLYTDGITEARQKSNKILMGMDQLIDILKNNADKKVEEIKTSILKETLDWCGNQPGDDITMMVLKRKM